MQENELSALVKKGESENLEFKTSTAEMRAVFETICAFLNTAGGTVLIGVKDDGRIIGQDVSPGTRKEIAREIKKIEPAVALDVDYIKINETKSVIAIVAKECSHAPYTYDGRAFYRHADDTSRMPQHRYEQLIIKRGQLNHSWEEFIADGYTIKDLDHEEIYRTVMDGIAMKRIPASIAKEKVEKILQQLALITDTGEIKRAAVVLFAKKIKPPYTQQCWLKMARFRGADKGGDFIDNQQEYCNVFHMLEVADSFLHKHLPMASYFKQDQMKRIDKFALPVLAVREALVNAICHKDYADRAGYISIAVFDDSVEIWNNGTLPEKLKIVDLKRKHRSILRNKLIAEVFYLRGYIEAWGTGIKKMTDSCKEHGLPAPKFFERTGGIEVLFKLAEPMGGNKIIKKDHLTARQQEILGLLAKQPCNSAQLINKLKDSPSRRTVQIDLVELEKLGLITREGQSRSITWVAISSK